MKVLGNHSDTRGHILRSALKQFAEQGYAGTSVQEIVDAAKVSKPALYYHFGDKSGLFQALVDYAHDERFRLMQQAEKRANSTARKLEEIIAELFNFTLKNQELMRLAFATAFAGAGETPCREKCRAKGKRNFDFIMSLIEAGQISGELDKRYSVEELAMDIYGQFNSYTMVKLLWPQLKLNRTTARNIVNLFMDGAANRQPARMSKFSSRRTRRKNLSDK